MVCVERIKNIWWVDYALLGIIPITYYLIGRLHFHKISLSIILKFWMSFVLIEYRLALFIILYKHLIRIFLFFINYLYYLSFSRSASCIPLIFTILNILWTHLFILIIFILILFEFKVRYIFIYFFMIWFDFDNLWAIFFLN